MAVGRTMKRITLFCDGTWSDPTRPNPTNVALLHQSTAARDGDIVQSNHYFDGVGVRQDWIAGGIWGAGLDGIVLDVYRRLCEVYELGDQIFLFGYSRGAYAARSVAGLVRKCGIVRRDRLYEADSAMALYRRRESTPDSSAAIAFRTANAAAWVDPLLLGAPVEGAPPDLARRMLRLRFLGVWDTVGALGVPEYIPFAALINKGKRFHDCSLSPCVEYARHALAIDETRNAFAPAPWTFESIAAVNALYREFRVEQDWFPGDHGSVGGGGERRELSDAALLWMADGARKAGLALDDKAGHLKIASHVANAVTGELRNTRKAHWLTRLRGEGPRLACTPRQLVDISEGARLRMQLNTDYLGLADKYVRWRRQTLAKVIMAMSLMYGRRALRNSLI